MKEGSGRIISGHFKLINVIDLCKSNQLIEGVAATINVTMTHIQKSNKCMIISTAKATKKGTFNQLCLLPMEIVSGIADWNEILHKVGQIIQYKNQQYTIIEKCREFCRVINDFENHYYNINLSCSDLYYQ